MKVIDCEQRSRKWFLHRLAHPTASEFSRVITSTGRASKQAPDYLAQLCAEWATGAELPGPPPSEWMERGVALEPQALAAYRREVAPAKVEQVGLLMSDDGVLCGSPDGLVDEDGLVEMKVPAPHTHLRYAITNRVPPAHVIQVQTLLHISQREWCDFWSWNPGLPALRIRVKPDPELQPAIAAAAKTFKAELVEAIAKLMAQGVSQGSVNLG